MFKSDLFQTMFLSIDYTVQQVYTLQNQHLRICYPANGLLSQSKEELILIHTHRFFFEIFN